MPASLLFDIGQLDLNKTIIDKEGIRKILPHRYEMEQIDGVLYFDKENHLIVGYKDVRPDEFWVRGHIPGRPLLPGVLTIESCAQMATVYAKLAGVQEGGKFIGFAGVDKTRFRGQVVPGDKLIIIIKCTEMRSRMATFQAQGLVNGKLVLEATIAGIIF